MNMETLGSIVLVAVLVTIALALLWGLPLMLLWNWLMPDIFNLPTIGFWQAVGLNFLSGILFRPSINTKN
jgi:hypothetical protein